MAADDHRSSVKEGKSPEKPSGHIPLGAQSLQMLHLHLVLSFAQEATSTIS